MRLTVGKDTDFLSLSRHRKMMRMTMPISTTTAIGITIASKVPVKQINQCMKLLLLITYAGKYALKANNEA